MAASFEKSAVDEYVINLINSVFGDNVKNLSKVKEVYQNYVETKTSLESKLSLASSEVPTEIENALRNAEAVKQEIQSLGKQTESLHREIQNHVSTLQPVVEEMTILTHKIQELEKISKYLSCIVRVDELSSEIQNTLLAENITKSVAIFQNLTSLYTTLHSSQCINLVGFAKETTLFWYKILRDKIAREFEDVLKQLNWPLIVTTVKTPPVHNPVETREKMDHLFKQLLQLQLPNSLNCDGQITPAGVAHILGLKPPILPLQLMLKSMRKRFRYHFYGKKQTNDLGKPEWYFTQVLSWIRDHRDFLDQRIQPLLNEAGRHSIDAKLEFMRGVVSLVIEKLDSDLPELMYDEHKFSHLVDEALLFDHELHLNYGYPTSYPSSLHVLTEGMAFDKWISVEKKFAIEKLDFMMSSSTAWKSQYKDIADVDEMKVPECGESFMTLMLTITDRYKHLPHPAHKIQFLDLQLELLEDFRIRIVQVMKDVTHSPLGDRYCAILNTTYYISEVLREWSELVFFVQLQYYKTQFANQSRISGNKPKGQHSVSMDRSYFVDAMEISDLDESSLPLESTVFEDMIQLFDRMRHDMLKTIVYHVFTDVKARSKPYRDARWLALPSQKDVVLGLSTSACEMLLVLKDHLLEVGQKISKPLFTSFWEKLAEKLNRFIYEEVILPNLFNEGGSAQLQFDMTRNLFPLFGEYTQRPESYFRDVKEACILLNLKLGSALLLNDVLAKTSQKTKKSSKSNDSDAKSALHEVGVFTLSPKQAAAVLKLRADLTT